MEYWKPAQARELPGLRIALTIGLPAPWSMAARFMFDVKQIHSIQYPAGSKFVRVTGVDMSKDLRRVFDPKTGEVREIKHVGTGSA